MSKVWAVFKRDINHVRGNAVALLVIMGLIIMPGYYAWFNIGGGWDPYGHSDQIKVAVANCDEGVKGDIVPYKINVGERVASSLAGSDKIGYVITSKEDAIEGTNSGKYYAALVIPEDFSTKLTSVFTPSPEHPEVDYYVNEKRNAIAPLVTEKATGSVQTMIDEGFNEAVAESCVDLFNEVSSLTNNEGVISAGESLNRALDNSIATLESSSGDIAAYKGIVASMRSVMGTSSVVVGDKSSTLNVSGSLSDAANSVRSLDGVVADAKGAANASISAGRSSMGELSSAIDDAFAQLSDKTGQLDDAFAKARDVAQTRRDRLANFRDTLNSLNGEIISRENSFADLQVAFKVKTDISDLTTRVDNAVDRLDLLLATIDQTSADLATTRANADKSKAELDKLAADAEAAIDSVSSNYDNNLGESLNDFANKIDDTASKAADISSSLKTGSTELSAAITQADTNLASLEDTLDNASKKIDESVNKLKGLRDKLAGAVSSGDVELIRTIMGGDSDALVSFLASPVELDREALFSVENSGSAMTPFYTTMSLWVGGTLMGLVLYTGISKDAEEETGAKRPHAYLGRLAFYLCVGFCQASLILLGDLYFLGVQCENPLLFLLTGWLASAVFLNIIYSLASSFGDAGKAIALFIMVWQVAGSGGTFPVQMLPPLFQKVYPYLPFVHSENAFRAAMFGVYNNDWAREMGLLALFILPALLLGLVLSKPFIKGNEWLEEKMEESKLM